MKKYVIIALCWAGGTLLAQNAWTLQQCVEYAYENNFNIKSLEINEKISELSLQSTQNEKLPAVNGYFNNSLNFGFQQTLFGTFEYNQSFRNSWGFDASLILWNKGRLQYNIEKQELQLEIQKLTTEDLKNDIALQVASLYLQILLNKELENTSKQSLEIGQKQLERSEILYKAGSIPLADLAEQQASFANDQQNYETAKINVNRALFQLANVLQLPDYKQFNVQDVNIPDDISLDILDIGPILEYAYGNQPSIKLAEHNILSAEKDINLAKTALFPTVSGGYSFGTTYLNFFNTREDDPFQQYYDNHVQSLNLNVSIPIFNKKQSKINIEQAQIGVESNQNQLETEKQNLKQDIQTAFFDVESSYQTYIAAKESLAANKTSFDLTEKSYAAGRITIYDFNISRNNYFIAQSRMLQAKYDYIFKRKVLDFYAGIPIVL